MILRKTSVLGALIVAVRKGKRIKEVTVINTDNMTVRDVTGKLYQVDYFVAIKPPMCMRGTFKRLGIEGTRNVTAYIKKRERSTIRKQDWLQESEDESAAA